MPKPWFWRAFGYLSRCGKSTPAGGRTSQSDHRSTVRAYCADTPPRRGIRGTPDTTRPGRRRSYSRSGSRLSTSCGARAARGAAPWRRSRGAERGHHLEQAELPGKLRRGAGGELVVDRPRPGHTAQHASHSRPTCRRPSSTRRTPGAPVAQERHILSLHLLPDGLAFTLRIVQGDFFTDLPLAGLGVQHMAGAVKLQFAVLHWVVPPLVIISRTSAAQRSGKRTSSSSCCRSSSWMTGRAKCCR